MYDGYPFKFNHGAGGVTEWVFLYHNTCVTDAPGQNAFMFKNYSGWRTIVSRNNVYAGTGVSRSAGRVMTGWDAISGCVYRLDVRPNLRTGGGRRPALP